MISQTSRPLYRANQVIWYVFSVIEGLLLLRFMLRLLQANSDAWFTRFVYGLTDALVYPFVAVFRNIAIETSVIEWVTLLAMLVYWFIAVAISQLLVMGRSVSPGEADRELSEKI